jgi:phosphatidylserine decarboxylase
MRLHKEGFWIIIGACLITILFNTLIYYFSPQIVLFSAIFSAVFLGLILNFFRNPVRIVPVKDNNKIYAPADGKVVVIEETEETEYFHGKMKQVSVFMSPLNVHVNRNPVGGTIAYYKYHPGQFLVAWHPKSSVLNERTTTVIDTGSHQILLRQVAGALAKRIINYLQQGEQVAQGSEMGFIKFGSRVDIYLPLDAVIHVEIGQVVKGNITVVASFNS